MKSILFVLAYAFLVLTSQAAPSPTYFASSPCVSPDGKFVVFTYEGDLWKVSIEGGPASRLTAMQGEESRAKFSPDGKWIAFSGSQYGNQDIFIVPAEGGEIQQITFHEAFDHMDDWSWDSKFIYFTSNRENRMSAYVVPFTGGTPKRMFPHFFHTVHNIAVHPNGEIFFSETSESKNQAYRKGYKGSYNPDIQSFNPNTKMYQKYTKYIGKDMWPTIDRNGKVYFVSDEYNGQYNLCVLDKNKSQHLTDFQTSIKQPIVSADGRYIVFEKDFQLYKYDVQSKKSSKIPVVTYSNTITSKEKDFSVQNNITYFDVSVDGKKLAFVSRGDLFVSDIKGKFVQKIKTNPMGRVTEVKWKSDNKSVIYAQTNKKGFTNLFSIRVDTISTEKQLTNVLQNDRDLSVNKSKTSAVFLSGRNDVKMIDLVTDSVFMLVREELWGFQNSTPSFSPNDEYVLFTAKRNFEEDIFIYNIESKQLTNLTKTGITENNPFWSPDGKYIYFTSNRTKPAYPTGMSDARVYRLPLEKLDNAFKSDKYDSLFVEKDKTSKPKSDSLATKRVVQHYSIDFHHMMDRVEQVSPGFGSQGKSYVIQKEGKTIVIYPSNHSENETNLWMTTYEVFESAKTEKIDGAKTFSTFITQSSDKYYCLIRGNIHTLNPEAKKVEKINIDYIFRRNLKAEFDQMFFETWANVKENFYNETFHGLNWDKVGEYYQGFLQYVNTRSDLRVLITEMLGDLNSSHTGFTSFGDEETIFYKSTTQGTGIIWDNDNPYQVKRIISYSPTDKKGINLRPGDRLVSVNEVQIQSDQNRESYFVKPSLDPELSLTFKRADTLFQIKIQPSTFNAINTLRYDEWIAQNQTIVDQKSNKKIAYAYMKDMGQGELNKFLIDMTSEAYDRDALILDIRYNNGGNVHDQVLQFLSQKPYLKWKYREGALTVQPNFTPAGKPIILLTNEQSLSDAEMTTAGFKSLGLGKVIGTETYRWIIFTSGKSLVDGSFYRLPSWGCYTLDGKNLEEVGVAPDIYVGMDFMDRLHQLDPQLDRAISEIKNILK